MIYLDRDYLESKGFYLQDSDFILWDDASKSRFVMREFRTHWQFFGHRTRNDLEIKCKVGTIEEFEYIFNFMVDSHPKLSYNNGEKGW